MILISLDSAALVAVRDSFAYVRAFGPNWLLVASLIRSPVHDIGGSIVHLLCPMYSAMDQTTERFLCSMMYFFHFEIVSTYLVHIDERNGKKIHKSRS
jgi:hypothetical protein